METCIGEFDTDLLRGKREKTKKAEIFTGTQKITPQKVDDADNVDLLIHDPVAKPHEPDREVFASTAVAALPC